MGAFSTEMLFAFPTRDGRRCEVVAFAQADRAASAGLLVPIRAAVDAALAGNFPSETHLFLTVGRNETYTLFPSTVGLPLWQTQGTAPPDFHRVHTGPDHEGTRALLWGRLDERVRGRFVCFFHPVTRP